MGCHSMWGCGFNTNCAALTLNILLINPRRGGRRVKVPESEEHKKLTSTGFEPGLRQGTEVVSNHRFERLLDVAITVWLPVLAS